MLASAAGAAGASIEGASGDPTRPVYEFTFAVERVRAAVSAVRSLPFPFTLTARADNLIVGRNDLEDTIRRLQAFETAGADVLYAPGLKDLSMVRQVLSTVSKPVNVVVTHVNPPLTAEELAKVGVKRISVGGSMSRFALAAFLKAATEMREGGFTFVPAATSAKDLKTAFKAGSDPSLAQNNARPL